MSVEAFPLIFCFASGLASLEAALTSGRCSDFAFAIGAFVLFGVAVGIEIGKHEANR